RANVDQAALENRLDLRSEEEPVAGLRPVERLDAEPIACEEQALPCGIPDGKCEHAAKVIDRRCTPLLVRMHDRFGIGTSRVSMAGRFEACANVAVVIDFAVEDDPDRLIFIRQRLMPGGEINDAQPAMTERG